MVLTDLDMNLDLEKHMDNSATFSNGSRIPKSTPRLGVSLNEKELEYFQKTRYFKI